MSENSNTQSEVKPEVSKNISVHLAGRHGSAFVNATDDICRANKIDRSRALRLFSILNGYPITGKFTFVTDDGQTVDEESFRFQAKDDATWDISFPDGSHVDVARTKGVKKGNGVRNDLERIVTFAANRWGFVSAPANAKKALDPEDQAALDEKAKALAIVREINAQLKAKAAARKAAKAGAVVTTVVVPPAPTQGVMPSADARKAAHSKMGARK